MNINNFFKIVLISLITTANAFIVSCSDDDNEKGPFIPKDKYGVYLEDKKLRNINGGANLKYNDENRVSQFQSNYSELSCFWRDNEIIVKRDNTNSYGQNYNTAYSITNGLVNKITFNSPFIGEGTMVLTYNGAGQIVKSELNSKWCESHQREYVWDGGRVLKITERCNGELESISTFAYENQICAKGYCPPTDNNELWDSTLSLELYEIIHFAHPELFGMRMNYLPSKIKIEDYRNNVFYDESEVNFEYTLDEEGYVIECTEKCYYDRKYTFTWE